jgi:hypothetical protein
MKINREFFKKDFFKKICGKVSNFTVNKGIGFKAVNTVNFEEITYVLGIKVKHTYIKNIEVGENSVLRSVVENTVNDKVKTPKRVIVKGFLTKKGVK